MFRFLPFKRAKWLFSLIFLGCAWIIDLGFTIGSFANGIQDLSLPLFLVFEAVCFSAIVIGYLFEKDKLMQVSSIVLFSYYLVTYSIKFVSAFGSINNAFNGINSSWIYGTQLIFMSLAGLVLLVASGLMLARFFIQSDFINDLSIIFLFLTIFILLIHTVFAFIFDPINSCSPFALLFILLTIIVVISGTNDFIFAK